MARRTSWLMQFITGLGALPRGAYFIWTTRASWPLALVPVLVCGLLCMGAIFGSIHCFPQLMAALWPGMDHTLGAFGTGVLDFIGIVLSSLFGMYVATFITPPLSAPALDHLVGLRERALGAPPRAAAGFWRELRCALMAQLVATGVFGPVLVLLTVIGWIAPPAALVTVPLKFLTLAALFAWSLLDYPLSLRGATVSVRLRLIGGGISRVLGFGMALAVVFALPFLALLLLPAAVAAAAEIALELERDDAVQRARP